MSGKQNDPSTKEREDQKGSSVFDFLYYDRNRIASYLSQFDNFGHLTGLTTNELIDDSNSKLSSTGLSGGIPTIASGKILEQTTVGSHRSKDSQRVYDPIWANALNFLDYLDEHDLLTRSLSDASIGKFVLHNGNLDLIDLGFIEKMWKMNSFSGLIRQGADQGSTRAERRRAMKSGQNNSQVNEVDMMIDLMGSLPHTIQATISNENESAWFNLSRESLTIESTDIALKHGYSVPGCWNIIGVLDAVPDIIQDNPFTQDLSDGIEVGSKLMKTFAPLTRILLGRPQEAFGLTPLLLFREITG